MKNGVIKSGQDRCPHLEIPEEGAWAGGGVIVGLGVMG